jgi:alginate O-acetyltransferase complex protein AlgI
VFFRAESIGDAAGILRAMAGLSPALPTAYTVSWYITPELVVAAAAGIIGSMPVVVELGRRLSGDGGAEHRGEPALGWLSSAAATAALCAILAASLMMIAAQTYNPFIYFRF